MAQRKDTSPLSPAMQGRPLYTKEYDAFVKVLANNKPLRLVLEKYAHARRRGAADMMLSPAVTDIAQIEQIRGKAYAFMELLAMCETAAQATKEGD